MAITKVGEDLIKEADLLWKATKGTGKFLYRRLKNIGRLGGPAVRATGGALNAAGRVGRFIVKNPRLGVPLATTAVLAGITAKRKFNKNYVHMDPDSDVTRYGALGIRYKDPRMGAYINEQNFLY